MIIVLGPDNSGKSTLASEIHSKDKDYALVHSVAATDYKDYIEFLRGPKSVVADISTYKPGVALNKGGKVVLDRFFYCDLPYSRVLRKERTKFNLKQWHNMHLSTIAFNPVVVLATRKAPSYNDSVPEELFEPILQEYKYWLGVHHINYITHDWSSAHHAAELLLMADKATTADIQWWIDMARQGVAGVGNTVDPKVLIMAQDLGPSNIHRIAFEQGPSGYYLSDLIDEAEIPLNSFYLTNWLKTNDRSKNVDYLRIELERLRPSSQGSPFHVILLGRDAEQSIPIIRDYVLPEAIHTVRHPGWVVNHSGTIKELNYRKEKYIKEWTELWKTILTSDSLLRV